MNQSASNNSNNVDALKSALMGKVTALLLRPKQDAKDNTPKNKSWIAILGFNIVMAFIDLISAVTVALLTSWLYGVLTFLAGFLALLLHENLFTNSHANNNQKRIAIVGLVIAILSTLGIGVLAGIVNVLVQFAGVDVSESKVGLEIMMIVGLVVIAVIHGVLWGFYYFTDVAHVRAMTVQANKAWRKQQREDIDNATEDVNSVIELVQKIEALGADKVGMLQQAYMQNTGQSLFNYQATDEEPPVIVTARSNGNGIHNSPR